MKFTRHLLLLVISSWLCVGAAHAAIQYGSTTSQASFAASTTKQVGNLLNSVASGDLTTGSSSAIDAPGILSGIGNFFVDINTWLHDNAGIDFFGILKGIGHFFLVIIKFIVGFLQKVL